MLSWQGTEAPDLGNVTWRVRQLGRAPEREREREGERKKTEIQTEGEGKRER